MKFKLRNGSQEDELLRQEAAWLVFLRLLKAKRKKRKGDK